MKERSKSDLLAEQLLTAKEAELADWAAKHEEAIAGYNETAEQIKKLRAALGMDETVASLPEVKLAAAPTKAKSAPKAKSTPKAKSKPKAKAKKKAKSAPKAKASPKVKGGRKSASKSVPRLIEAIQIVMGKSTATGAEIHAELKRRHWLPNSDDPLGYIRYTLSANKNLFLRVEGDRGHYYLDPSNPYASGKKTHDEPKEESVPAPKAAVVAPEPVVAEVPKAEPKKAEPKVEAPKVEAKKAEPKKAAPVVVDPLDPESPEAIVDSILSSHGVGSFS